MVWVMSKSLAQQLNLDHLADASDEELRTQIEETAVDRDDAQETSEETSDPRLQEEYPFEFSYRDDRGKLWEGSFINQILDINQKGKAAVLEATLNQGMPHESMPGLMKSIHHAVAHMTFSLTERPSWAKNLRKLKDTNVIFALFGEVAEHEAKFLGRQPYQEEGEEGSE